MENISITTRNTSEYKDNSVEETLKFLQTSKGGLAESEVKKRLQKFGFNEVYSNHNVRRFAHGVTLTTPPLITLRALSLILRLG